MVWWLSLGLALSGLLRWGMAQELASRPGAGLTHLVEKGVARPGEAVITSEKYALSSGLNRFILEDHSDPLVWVELAFHVGMARKTVGESGVAHFFAHMPLLEGTAHAAPGQGVKILSAAGSKDPNATLALVGDVQSAAWYNSWRSSWAFRYSGTKAWGRGITSCKMD